MEKYLEFFLRSQKLLRTADHLAYVTYPVVTDPKLIISMTENIYSSATDSMFSLIEYELLYKKIELTNYDFEEKFNIFKTKLRLKYNIDLEFIELIKELKEIMHYHKENNKIFTRRGKVCIYSTDFKTKSLDINDIKKYISKIKRFINKLDMIYKV